MSTLVAKNSHLSCNTFAIIDLNAKKNIYIPASL